MNTNRDVRLIKREIEYLKTQRKYQRWDLTISRTIKALENELGKIHKQQNVDNFVKAVDGDWLK